MNNIAVMNKNSCTGCGACAQVCSKNCIQMISDDFGFLYPEVSDNCIYCGKCLTVCPTVCKPLSVESREKPCYMLTTKNKKLEAKSASGGFCAALASYFIKSVDGIVFGCVMTPVFDVCHQSITCEKDIYKIQGSKYVQSNTQNTFTEAKEILDAGKYVLYMATPCQIAGLKSYLSKDYPKLITVDLICHGVPSGQAFKNYIEYLSKTSRTPVKEYTFRNKTRYDRTGFISKTEYNQGKAIYKKPFEDIFFGLFSKGKIYRRSCYSCQYACIQRQGDFTCGDCGSRILHNDFLPYEAMSSLILNTDKALSLWNGIQNLFEFTQIDFETEVRRNKQLRECTALPADRDEICKAMIDSKWELLSSKYLSNGKRSLLRKISGRIPISFKQRLFKIIRVIKSKNIRKCSYWRL